MNTPVQFRTSPRIPTEAGRRAHEQARPTLHLRVGTQNVSTLVGAEASRDRTAARISIRRARP